MLTECCPWGTLYLVWHFSSFLEWTLQERNSLWACIHYLGNFFVTIVTGQSLHLLVTFNDLARELRFPLADKKTEGPKQCLTFLDVEIDAIAQTSCLHFAKLTALRVMVLDFLGRCKVILWKLQQLVGNPK